MSSAPPAPEHVRDLHDLLLVYDEALDAAITRIRNSLGVDMTSRLKNTGTILEKLRRSGGGSLPNLQDIAGIRIVVDVGLGEQTDLAEKVAALFAGERREPKIIDRREQPSHGYRAVHVVVHARDLPVEVQVRTRLQHQWANTFEKLADVVGRGIRYGEPPDEWLADIETEFKDLLRSDQETELPNADEALYRRGLIGTLLDLTLRQAAAIAYLETAFPRPDRPNVDQDTTDAFDHIHHNLRVIHQAVERITHLLMAQRERRVVGTSDGSPDGHVGTVGQ